MFQMLFFIIWRSIYVRLVFLDIKLKLLYMVLWFYKLVLEKLFFPFSNQQNSKNSIFFMIFAYPISPSSLFVIFHHLPSCITQFHGAISYNKQLNVMQSPNMNASKTRTRLKHTICMLRILHHLKYYKNKR